MKYTNANAYKLAIVATSFVMVYFASGIASIAQASELVQAEPVQQVDLIKEAKESLKLSFSTLVFNSDFDNNSVNSTIAEQKNTVKESQMTNLTKATLISE